MGELVELDVTTVEESVTVNVTEEGQVDIAVFAETGPAGPAGPNSVTSATTSDGTANLSISNVTTATATVSGTLTANHIHGNIAGSVYAHVRAGENLAKGDPVYVSGSHGTGANLIAIVSKADASNAAKMPAVGVMDAAVSNNANGHMVITGTISDLDTNAYTVNAELYVASGGGLTATPPTTLCQPVARVERSNTNNGAVIVKVNGLSSKSAIENTLVRRGVNGDASFSTSANDTVTLNLESNGDFAGTAYPSAVNATAVGLDGIGANIYSNSGWGAVITSNLNTGAVITSNSGTYHADFGNGDNRSAIERVRGWFVWFYNTFTGRLKTANITANRDWTLPNKSGTILLDSDLGSNVATFLATPTSANLAAAVTGETGTGALVFANSPTLTGTPLIGTKIILSENGFQRAFLSSDYTIASTNTGNKIPSFSISVESGKTYKLEIMLKVTGVAGSTHNSTLTGSFNLTAANSSMLYRRAGFETESFVLASTPFSGFGLFNTTGTSSQICFLDGIIKPTSSGVLEVVLYSSSAINSVTMLKGAYMEATLLD